MVPSAIIVTLRAIRPPPLSCRPLVGFKNMPQAWARRAEPACCSHHVNRTSWDPAARRYAEKPRFYYAGSRIKWRGPLLVSNAKITRSGLQLRSMTDVGGPKGTKDGKSKRPLLPSRLLASLTPHENIYTVPNILTFSRLIAAPVVGYLIIQEQHLSALGLFVYAGITDLVDGWIARNWGLQTVVGTVIDPMADKMLMTIVTICLAVKAAIPVSLAAVILGRDAILGLVAIYIRYISLPAPKTFVRYWDFSLPSAEVRPTGISKINTALQLALVGWTMTGMAIGGDLGIWGEDGALRAMWYLVGATTVWSGVSYIYTKDAVKILNAGIRKQRSGKL